MKDFENRRQEYLRLIENALVAYLPNNTCLQHSVIDAMAYSLLGGGKRIRAILTLEFCRINGGTIEMAMPFACAIEMIHASSLIHDDLPCMDDDDFRRGKPSCHKAFGEAIAVLAGDALITLAYETMAKADLNKVQAENVVKAVGLLSNATGTYGMIGGQTIDIEHEDKPISAEILKDMHAKKTGALIWASAGIGGVVANADDKTIELIKEYTHTIGVAFQIVDDILDVTGTAEELGKPVNSDKDNNKTTYVTLYGIDKAQKIADDLLLNAKEILRSMDKDTEFLVGLTEMLVDRKS